ncbi:MAG: thioredoxin [Alistipes sp.]
MALEITKENYEQIVASELPVVMDFWAEWCGPCRAITPFIEEIAKEYEGKAIVGKCNVEGNDDIVMNYGVRNIPTVIFLKGGKLIDKQVGACQKSDLVAKLEKLL